MSRKDVKKAILGIILCVFGFASYFAIPAYADTFGSDTLKTQDLGISSETDFRKVIVQIIKVVLSFIALLAVIMIVIAGIVWMTSGGNPERVATARKMIFSAIIGLIVIIFSYLIVEFIARQFR